MSPLATPGRVALALLLGLVAGCRPSTITEAERKGDVAWLDQNGTPDAVDALGRLADAPATSARALGALAGRSAFDAYAFKAAWAAGLRGQPWGFALLREGLADPARADLAASATGKGDPHLAELVGDLEAALQRLSASAQNFNVASALASAGASAHEAVSRRLSDASTRGAMCRGIASEVGSSDARAVLRAAPLASRDAQACVDGVVRIAAQDEPTLAWLADQGEPGLLGAAGKSDALPCARLHHLWARALPGRAPEVYSALTVPLGYSVNRCPAELDGVLADAIVHLPAVRAVVVEAIDPFTGHGSDLRATCAALPAVVGGRDSALVREHASDALAHACKTPG